MATAREIGQALGLSEVTVRNLRNKKILPNGLTPEGQSVRANTDAYEKYRSQQQRGRRRLNDDRRVGRKATAETFATRAAPTASQASAVNDQRDDARAIRDRAEAKRAVLRVGEMEKNLIPLRELQKILNEITSVAVSRLDSITARLKTRYPELPPKVIDGIGEEIAHARNEIADYVPTG